MPLQATSARAQDSAVEPETGEREGGSPGGEDGPTITLPEEAEGPEAPEGVSPEDARDNDEAGLRDMQEARFERATTTSVGGYGELHFNWENAEGTPVNEAELDLHRLVVFLAHNFNERIRFYGEVEIEHAFLADTDGGSSPGEVAIEQAYVDWKVLGDTLGLRAGMFLVPMGIINQWHEPPVFHGVERPYVDRVVIPTTWSEGGIGVFGEPLEGLRYELYLTTGLDARGFSAGSGIRGGRQGVGEAMAKQPAVTGRVEYEPILGLVAGASAYFGLAGRNVDLNADVPVGGFAIDGRLLRAGVEARALLAYFGVGDAGELNLEAGTDAGSSVLGAYGEVAVDVLHTAKTAHQFLPFLRIEWYDTTLNADAVDTEPGTHLVLGLSYRPIPQFVLKGDGIIRIQKGGGDATQANLGVGWMF